MRRPNCYDAQDRFEAAAEKSDQVTLDHIMLGRDHFWLPQWLLKRSVAAKKVKKTMHKWLRKPARFRSAVISGSDARRRRTSLEPPR